MEILIAGLFFWIVIKVIQFMSPEEKKEEWIEAEDKFLHGRIGKEASEGIGCMVVVIFLVVGVIFAILFSLPSMF